MDSTDTAHHVDKDMKEQTTMLIALLDRVHFLKGGTLTNYPNRPETTLPPLPTDGTPIAVQMYETPSLLEHLEAHEKEAQENNTLATRIHDLSKKGAVARAAHERLVAEHAAVPSAIKDRHLRETERERDRAKKRRNKPENNNNEPRPPSPTTPFNLEPLHRKIALLRPLQQLATQPPHPPDFTTHVVTALDRYGRPNPLTHIHLPVTTDWRDYSSHLTSCTQHWQSTEDGCPDGYTLKEGKWMYQFVEIGEDVVKKEALRFLGSESDYRGMRKELGRKGIEDFGVLVWHERIKAASDAAREREAETRELWGDIEEGDGGTEFELGGEGEDGGAGLEMV